MKFFLSETFKIVEGHEFANLKGSQRIQVNNILAAISIALIPILITDSSTKKISDWIMVQLSASIPLLITSSLFYTKCCYRPQKEYDWWNSAAMITHSLGYFGIINSTALLMYYHGYTTASWSLIIAVVISLLCYSAIDVFLKPTRFIEKLLKLIFYLLTIRVGTDPMTSDILKFIHKLIS